MDNIQKAICAAYKQSFGLISDRQRLRSALSDVIPTEKLLQNILLNAYDEDVVPKFKADNGDIAMRALKLIRDLVDGYGLTDDSATWSVSTWCYMLGHDEVAELIGGKLPSAGGTSVHQPTNSTIQYRQEYSFMSVYKAGKDFPSGTIQIIVNGKLENHCNIYVKDEPRFHWVKDRAVVNDFIEQAYVDIKDGEYLYTYVLDDIPINCTQQNGHLYFWASPLNGQVFRVKPHLVDTAELLFMVSCIRSSRKQEGSDRREKNS